MFSKCANPECLAPFDYHEGKFFRFHKSNTMGEAPANTHSVQHFWLCATCAHDYTLEYRDGIGVLIKVAFEDGPGAESEHLVAAP